MAVDPSRAAAVALEAPAVLHTRSYDRSDELRLQANALRLIDHHSPGADLGGPDAKGRLHGRCVFPRHEDASPSFCLFPDGGFTCSCGSGDVIRLSVELQGAVWHDNELQRYERELRDFLGMEQRRNGRGSAQRSSIAPSTTVDKASPESHPFALELTDFIGARSDAPPALVGAEEDILFPAFGLVLLVAKGGKGKTTMVIDQVFHLASGIDWLGFKVPRPLRILLIENEGPREPFRRKIEQKREHWPHPITEGSTSMPRIGGRRGSIKRSLSSG
jgi:hypothetical protein